MKMYQARMCDELNELNERIEKLERFIKENENYKSLSKKQQDLMSIQWMHMKNYASALSDRIDLEDFTGEFIYSQRKRDKLIEVANMIADLLDKE